MNQAQQLRMAAGSRSPETTGASLPETADPATAGTAGPAETADPATAGSAGPAVPQTGPDPARTAGPQTGPDPARTAGTAELADPGGTQAAGPQSGLRLLRSRGRARGILALLGPAFVAAVAYIDPGNFATNFSAGARFGYALAWVIVLANLMAMLVQYLSAKTGVATGRDLPELCRAHLPPAVSAGLWVQAECIAMATDVAEFVGAAVGLNLLFHVPLLPAGLITAVVAFGVLALEQRGYRRFELAISGLLGIVLLGFVYDQVAVGAKPGGIAAGLVPRFPGRQPAAGGRHHRGDGNAARGLPALGADQVPGALP